MRVRFQRPNRIFRIRQLCISLLDRVLGTAEGPVRGDPNERASRFVLPNFTRELLWNHHLLECQAP